MLIKLFILSLCFLSPQLSAAAGADLNAENLLNSLCQDFLNGAETYIEPIKLAASRLFWSLLGFSVILGGISFALKNEDIPSFLAFFVKLCINAGVFLFLLDNGNAIGISIVDSLTSITNTKNQGPSELLDLSFNTFNQLLAAVKNSNTSLIFTALMYLSCYAYLILMFLLVIDYTITYVSAYMLCILGTFALGFGAFEYTRDIAVGVLRQVIYFALRLMTMIMICNTGAVILEKLSGKISTMQNLGINDFNTIIFTTIFVFILSKKIPHLIGSLVLNVNFNADLNLGKFFQGTARILK